MKLTLQTNDGARQLVARPDEKILHAALSAGVSLPYECATGTCGSCKVRLTAGRVAAGWPEAPGAGRCGADEILSCQHAALTDCTLAVPRLRPVDPGAARPAALKGFVRRRRRLTADVMEFDVAPEAPVGFDAGQFVLFETPLFPGARAYSIAGVRDRTSDLRFVAKRKIGGRFTGWLFGEAEGVEGAPLDMFGPLGRATFRPEARAPIVCVAGGSGLAGMLSILHRAGEAGHFGQAGARLWFGVRRRQDLFLLEELDALRERHPDRLAIDVALSDEEPLFELARQFRNLSFRAGLVHEVLGRQIDAPLTGAHAYVAGPRAMVDATVRVLVQQGRLPPRDVRYDRFD